MHEFVKLSMRASLRGGAAYYGWLALLGVGVLLGAGAYGYQLSRGLAVTHLSDQVAWGAYIGNFNFLVGIAAAAVILVIPAYVYRDHAMGEVVVLGELMAIAAVVMCMAFVIVDLGRPDRFWHMLPLVGRFNWPASLLAWDLLVLLGYLGLNLYLAFGMLYAKFAGRDAVGAPPPSIRRRGLGPAVAVLPPVDLLRAHLRTRVARVRPVVYVAIVWAIAIHTVTAFLYTGLGGRPYWHTAIHAPNFLATAFSAGPAAMIVVLFVLRERLDLPVRDSAITRLRQVAAIALLIHLFLLGSEIFSALYTGSAHAAGLRYRLFGWDGHVGLVATTWGGIGATVVAVSVLLTERLHRRVPLLLGACCAAVVGVWVDKSLGMVVPGFVPTPLGATVDYHPSLVEWCITVGVFAGGALLLTLMLKAAVAVQLAQLVAAPAAELAGTAPPAATPAAAGVGRGVLEAQGDRVAPVLATRHDFDQRIAEEWRRARRRNEDLTLIFVGVDATHPAGGPVAVDEPFVLAIAEILLSTLHRPGDFVARYAGAALAVILPDTGAEGAVEVAEAIRRRVAERAVARSAETAESGATVSLGVGVMPRDSEIDVGQLLSAAQTALAVAHGEGPNQTRVAIAGH